MQGNIESQATTTDPKAGGCRVQRFVSRLVVAFGGGVNSEAMLVEMEKRGIIPDPNCENWYPLIEWGLHRDDCVEICKSEGLPAAKSSCFYCPSMRKPEVLTLAKEHPELMARAIAMENNAELTTVKGLGRHWKWENLVNNDADQMRLFSDAGTPEIACGCYDG